MDWATGFYILVAQLANGHPKLTSNTAPPVLCWASGGGPQIADRPMSFTLVSHIATVVLTGHKLYPINQTHSRTDITPRPTSEQRPLT